MVLLGRAMVCFHRLSVQTTVESGTICLQFVMQVFTGGCEPPSLEERLVVWGPLSDPVVASYRLPIVTIVLSPFSQCSDLSWTRWNWSSKRRHYASATNKDHM